MFYDTASYFELDTYFSYFIGFIRVVDYHFGNILRPGDPFYLQFSLDLERMSWIRDVHPWVYPLELSGSFKGSWWPSLIPFPSPEILN